MLKTWWDDLDNATRRDAHWVIAWATIYVSFIILDILIPNWPGTALIKYLGIFLCIVYAYGKYPSDLMLVLALFFTFLADTILVWTPWTVAGVYIFCFAQFMHFLRLSGARMAHIFTCAAIVSMAFAAAIIQGLHPIYAIGSIYALILCCNAYTATKRYLKNRQDFHARCTFYGFCAYVCCDLCVTLRYFALHGILSTFILPVVSYLVWVFYFPSQVLIANSTTLPEPAKRAKSLRNN